VVDERDEGWTRSHDEQPCVYTRLVFKDAALMHLIGAGDTGCGIAPDFLTPEYAQFKTTQSSKWESCEGMDPFSFGYNKRTPEDQYR
jgi:hypothetical protein